MPFLSKTPKSITHPDVPYDRLAVNLAISPRWYESDVGGNVAFQAIPYRIVEGKVEKLESAAISQAFGDVFEDAKADKDLAVAMGAIMAAIQGYITAKKL